MDSDVAADQIMGRKAVSDPAAPEAKPTGRKWSQHIISDYSISVYISCSFFSDIV